MIVILSYNLCTKVITVKYFSLPVKKEKVWKVVFRSCIVGTINAYPVQKEKSWIRLNFQKEYNYCISQSCLSSGWSSFCL